MDTMISLDRIHKNPDNPRGEVGDVTELAASIREVGLLQSLLVRPAFDRFGEGHYILEAGERRWTAMRLGTDMTEASCRIWEPPADTNPQQHSLQVGLIENVHREPLNPIEKARAYGRLRDEFGMTQKEIAASVGQTDSTINYYLALLELSVESQLRVIKGTVSVTEAVKAVRQHRSKQRRMGGQKPHGVSLTWEPDHFTVLHPLARRAEAMCDMREHTKRRRLGKKAMYRGACGACWEVVIRQDQDKVTQARIADEVGEELGQKIRFLAPVAAVENNR